MTDRPFARVYYVDLERDYPEVYHDDHLYATWGRLLAIAEAMWPVVPEIPRSAKAAYVKALVATSLVIRDGAYGYRIKGLDDERTARRTAARTAASKRWRNAGADAPGYADAYADAMPRVRDQTRPDQSNDSPPPQVGSRKDGANPRALGTNPRANGHSPRQEREAQKRGGLQSLNDILAKAALVGHDE